MSKRFLPKSEFARNVAILMTGSSIAQAIPILVAPVLTRLYAPEDFGVLAAFMAILGIISVFATGQFELAIVLPDKDKDSFSLSLVGIVLAAIVSLIVLFAVVFCGHTDFYPSWINVGDNRLLYLLPCFVFFEASNKILNRNLSRFKKYKNLAQSKVAWQISNNSFKLVFGLLGFSSVGLFVGTLVGIFVAVCCQFINMYVFFRQQISKVKLDDLMFQMKRYKKFPLVSSWSSLMNVASIQIPVLMFTTLFSTETAGFFSLSNKIVSIPMIFIGASIAQVFMEKAAKIKNDSEKLKIMTLSVFKKSLLVGTLGLSIITFYGDLLFPFVFGEEWARSGIYSQWISVWRIFIFAASPLSAIFFVLERQGESLIWNFFILFSRVFVIFIAWHLAFSDIKTIALFSLVGIFFWVLMSVRILNLSGVAVMKGFLQLVLFFAIPFLIQWMLSIPVRSFFIK